MKANIYDKFRSKNEFPEEKRKMKIQENSRVGFSLEQIKAEIINLPMLKKCEVEPGDTVLVFTENSLYHILVLSPDLNLIFGGWFDRNNLSPQIVSINGCSLGSSIIQTNIFAACGLHLEFSNRVVTSAIKKIIFMHGNGKN
jgi:hypothetical protein